MIERINNYAITSGQPGIINEEAFTTLELVGKCGQKVNECIDQVNTNTDNVTTLQLQYSAVRELAQTGVRNAATAQTSADNAAAAAAAAQAAADSASADAATAQSGASAAITAANNASTTANNAATAAATAQETANGAASAAATAQNTADNALNAAAAAATTAAVADQTAENAASAAAAAEATATQGMNVAEDARRMSRENSANIIEINSHVYFDGTYIAEPTGTATIATNGLLSSGAQDHIKRVINALFPNVKVKVSDLTKCIRYEIAVVGPTTNYGTRIYKNAIMRVTIIPRQVFGTSVGTNYSILYEYLNCPFFDNMNPAQVSGTTHNYCIFGSGMLVPADYTENGISSSDWSLTPYAAVVDMGQITF